MRAMRMPGVEQTSMTYEQNKSRCESASTERYDYREDVCAACKKGDERGEKDVPKNMEKQKEFRTKERAELMKRDYDHRQNMARERSRIEKTYAEVEKRVKEAKDKEATDMRESAERQYRAQGLSQQRISQLLWSDEERREWGKREEERLVEQRETEKREKELREKGKEKKRMERGF